MLPVLVVLICLAVSGSDAWYNVQCSNQTEDTVDMKPTQDGVKGRYVVMYCTHSSPPPITWYLELHTMDKPVAECTYDVLQEINAGRQHSSNEEKINASSVDTTCPYVCLYQPMDLIFEACYQLSNQVIRQGKTIIHSEKITTYQYIDNKIPPYNKNITSAFVECIDFNERVVCTWFEGLIPYTSYYVRLLPFTEKQDSVSELVTDNCTRTGGAGGAVRCELALPPGQYSVELVHTAPWTRGLNDLVHHRGYFNVTPSSELRLEPAARGHARAWAASGAALLLAVSLLAGLLVYQKRQKAKLKIKVWQEWLARKAEGEEGERRAPPGPVLLLYARDCPPAQRAAAALAALLAEHNCGQVLDLYSAEQVARAAASPAALVREWVAAPRVRVLLLQTPALAALHAARLTDGDAFHLEEPLLARRVVYRTPQFGDTLLQFALQLLATTAHAHHVAPYKKYYLATVGSLAVDVLPSVVPFTRFELPHAAPALLAALGGDTPPAPPAPPDTPPAPPAPALWAACDELVQFVQDNPNYLADELMFL